MTDQQKPERWGFSTDGGKAAEGRTLRPLIYLDDVLQPEGAIEMREVPVSPNDRSFDPDEPSTFNLLACIVNGRPARPVGPAVINMGRQTVIWRFKTLS